MSDRTPADRQDSTPRQRSLPNTRSRDESLMLLADGLVTGDPSGAIERQEARGQRDLVNSDVLPTNVDRVSKAALEAAGVVFGALVDGDPLFTYVTLPSRWKKVATDHSMWSRLVDDQGRVRARIGYKAASYDRWATLSAAQRFESAVDYSDAAYQAQQERGEYVGVVRDGDTVIYRVVFTDPKGADQYADDSAYNRARETAQAWLAARYPNYLNVAAYWDLPPVAPFASEVTP